MPRRRTIPAPPPVERSFMDLAVNYFLDAPVGEINVLMPVIDAIVARRLCEPHQTSVADALYPPDPVDAPMTVPDAPALSHSALDPNPLRTARRRRRRATSAVGPVAVPAAEPAGAEGDAPPPYDGTVGEPDVVEG